MHDTFVSGNGNGNKMNLRIEIIEDLLNASGDGNSAKINSLRQAIRRNKSDMADNTTKSLDVLRQVFQHEMTDEIRQIIDRHLRTTFAPAFENLKRNGHEVSQKDISTLCVSILDGAKEPFIEKPKLQEVQGNDNAKLICIPSYAVLKSSAILNYSTQKDDLRKVSESDDNDIGSDSSMISYNSTLSGVPSNAFGGENRPRKRGRPRKVDIDSDRSKTPVIQGTQPVTMSEALKWNPERIHGETRFVLGSKANKILGGGHRNQLFTKYSRFFRYTADDEDKTWLFDRNLSTRISGKVYFMVLDDCLEIAQLENASGHSRVDLKRYSFLIPEKILLKMRHYMTGPFEKLKSRVIMTNATQLQFQNHHQAQIGVGQPPLLAQPSILHPQTMGTFSPFN